ncbi:MAG: type II secretion system protein GspM [Myxococcaceae bacterium]
MDQLKQLIAPVQTWFQSLSLRERRLVLMAGSAVLVFVLLMTFLSFSSSARSYQKRTDQKLTQLTEVQQLAMSFHEAEQARANVENNLRRSDVKLITYLEEKGTAVGLDIPTMNPKGDLPIGDGTIIESSVELTLTDITLTKLVDFLNAVEAGPGVVKVKYLRVEPKPANENLTAWATIATYRMK